MRISGESAPAEGSTSSTPHRSHQSPQQTDTTYDQQRVLQSANVHTRASAQHVCTSLGSHLGLLRNVLKCTLPSFFVAIQLANTGSTSSGVPSTKSTIEVSQPIFSPRTASCSALWSVHPLSSTCFRCNRLDRPEQKHRDGSSRRPPFRKAVASTNQQPLWVTATTNRQPTLQKRSCRAHMCSQHGNDMVLPDGNNN